MADYFVSTNGSDSTGDGSWSNPWATPKAALDGGGSPKITLPASGPTRLIVEPGVYWDAFMTLRLSPSAAAPLEIIGDYDGALFGAAGKPNPKTGPVELRAWSDVATPKKAPVLNLDGKSHVTVKRLSLIGSSQVGGFLGAALSAEAADNLHVADCVLRAAEIDINWHCAVNLRLAAGAVANILFERCVVSTAGMVDSSAPAALYIRVEKHSADYDPNVLIRNCLFHSAARGVSFSGTGSGVGRASAARILGCSFVGPFAGSYGAAYATGFGAGTAPVAAISHCAMIRCRTGLHGDHASVFTENYNVIDSFAPRTNVPAGANSVTAPAWAAFSGDDRPFGSPLPGSPLLGFAARPVDLIDDFLGNPRPNPCAAGCLELYVPPEPEPPVGNTYIFQVEG